MKVYVAGVTSERQYVKSLNSFHALKLSPGDVPRMLDEVTRGDLARMTFCDDFLDGEEDAIAFLDVDMVHPPNLIERLKSHNVDMVTAHYWKRQPRMESVCGTSPDGTWPYLPLDVTNLPNKGLVEIASTGLGAVLIKREVIETVKRGLKETDHPFALGPHPEMVNSDVVMGSDMRFFHEARKAGYKLWLDCELESLHGTTIWLSTGLYKRIREPDWELEQTRKLFYAARAAHGENEKTAIIQDKITQLEREVNGY